MLRQTHFVPPVPLVVATELGMLDRAGVELERSDTRGSGQQMAQLMAGEQDIAVTASDNLFIWNLRGADVRIIAQMERTTPLFLFTQTGIRSVKELENRSFAVDALDNGFSLAARRILIDADTTVRFVEVGGVRERMEALIAGDAEATLLGPPFDSMAAQHGLNRLASINELLPGYPGQVLVAGTATIRNRPEELESYVTVLADAVQTASKMSDADWIDLLIAAGFPRVPASALWQERPRSIQIDVAGLGVIENIRRGLDLLPSGHGELDEMYDGTFATHAKRSA